MRFGPVPPGDAVGAMLAHSLKRGAISFRKGRILSAADAAALEAAGIDSIVAARFDADDVLEDEAAAAIAAAIAGAGTAQRAPFTGRANLMAESAGVAVIDRDALDRLNLVDEAVTVATVAPYDMVEARQLVATVKIIPFAVPRAALDACLAVAREAAPLVRIAPLRPKRIALIQTVLSATKPSVLDSTAETTRARVETLGSTFAGERRCPHETVALAEAIAASDADILLVAGASAIVDRRDVIPAAIEAAGGHVEHFGMPVDPGNLLLLGRREGGTVLGLPGCARSPKLNGFDWVLQRLCADVPVSRRDVMLMGSGGLLKEIAVRPQPREPAPAIQRAPRVTAVLLAAGSSTRMGRNKLLLPVQGKPMIAHAVEALRGAAIGRVVVVTGHEAGKVREALAGYPVELVDNPAYAEGISSSVKAGAAAAGDADAVLIGLGDMPLVTSADLDRLIAAFNPTEGRSICVPTFDGTRGNPILWARRFLPEMASLSGDQGAKPLLRKHADQVCEVAMSHDGVLRDADTPAAFAALTGATP